MDDEQRVAGDTASSTEPEDDTEGHVKPRLRAGISEPRSGEAADDADAEGHV